MRIGFRVACALALAACTAPVYESRLAEPTAVPDSAGLAALKVHLMSGDLVVLRRWQRSDSGLAGTGERYGLTRTVIGAGNYFFPFDSIALLETTVRQGSRPAPTGGMVVWTTLWTITTIACVADPKACFGSCPTFYVGTDTGEVLVAEGFSSSIARVLEARDLDALFHAPPPGRTLTIRMRNEAWETHAVRGLRLQVAPRPPGGRVLAAPDDRLYPAARLRAPARCRAAEGDCRRAVLAADGVERTSRPDSTDLAAQESIELLFPAATGRLGVVLGARQSLMTTYLFYQTMGFLGRRAGEALAALERGGRDAAQRAMGMARLVGPIAVAVWEGDGWRPIGVHDEAGPLATQVAVIPFTKQARGPVRVRLTASRGAWRFDWLALAELGDPVVPLALEPAAVLRDGRPDTLALARLRDRDTHLVTYPGDTYDVVFRLPRSQGDVELLLESEGYYYEWMRSEWLGDENAALALLALARPAAALRALAPGFARAEPRMDSLFWSSRFGR